MSSPESRIRLLEHDGVNQRQTIETYIYDKLVRFDTIEKYDINDPTHNISDIFSKIEDRFLKQMFDSSRIPYTNENIAAILDAANLRRVKKIIAEIRGSSWFTKRERVLDPHPFSAALSKVTDYLIRDVVDVEEEERMDREKQQRLDKYNGYLVSIEGGNTFASRVHTLPTGVCSKFSCSMLGGGFGRVKKTKKKVRRSKRKYKNVRRKNKSHRKKVY